MQDAHSMIDVLVLVETTVSVVVVHALSSLDEGTTSVLSIQVKYQNNIPIKWTSQLDY